MRHPAHGTAKAQGDQTIDYTPGREFVDVGEDRFTYRYCDVVGPDAWFPMPWPVMGAEDFSYVLQRVPGAMVFLGVCPDDIANSLDFSR